MILDRADGRECQSYDRGRFFPSVSRCALWWYKSIVGMVALRDMLRALRGRQQARHARGLRLLPHPECELAPCTLQEVHEALGRTGD